MNCHCLGLVFENDHSLIGERQEIPGLIRYCLGSMWVTHVNALIINQIKKHLMSVDLTILRGVDGWGDDVEEEVDESENSSLWLGLLVRLGEKGVPEPVNQDDECSVSRSDQLWLKSLNPPGTHHEGVRVSQLYGQNCWAVMKEWEVSTKTGCFSSIQQNPVTPKLVITPDSPLDCLIWDQNLLHFQLVHFTVKQTKPFE